MYPDHGFSWRLVAAVPEKEIGMIMESSVYNCYGDPVVKRAIASGFPTVMDEDEAASHLADYGLLLEDGRPTFGRRAGDQIVAELEELGLVRHGRWVSAALEQAFTPSVLAYVDYLRSPCTYSELQGRWPELSLPRRPPFGERMLAMLGDMDQRLR